MTGHSSRIRLIFFDKEPFLREGGWWIFHGTCGKILFSRMFSLHPAVRILPHMDSSWVFKLLPTFTTITFCRSKQVQGGTNNNTIGDGFWHCVCLLTLRRPFWRLSLMRSWLENTLTRPPVLGYEPPIINKHGKTTDKRKKSMTDMSWLKPAGEG